MRPHLGASIARSQLIPGAFRRTYPPLLLPGGWSPLRWIVASKYSHVHYFYNQPCLYIHICTYIALSQVFFPNAWHDGQWKGLRTVNVGARIRHVMYSCIPRVSGKYIRIRCFSLAQPPCADVHAPNDTNDELQPRPRSRSCRGVDSLITGECGLRW